jgi:leucyl-tRNA synthetase
MPRYNPATIEPRWQKYWEENTTFKTPDLPAGEKRYVLDMFPYPSGDGLHVGHPEGYTATDIVCRFERMRGKSVLHPMGFDAFGLPAEEHAIKTNTPPRVSTEKNIATFRRQLKMLGFSYDWSRELATTDVEYVRWTQWIFLVLFDTWFDAEEQQKGRPIAELPIPADVKAAGEGAVRRYQDEHRLAFQADALVNWCAGLGTVLANEEVQDGKSERGGHPVERIPLRQWMLRITAYADRLEKDLDLVDWSPSIKTMQREWIGRSTGAEVDFYIGDGDFEAWKQARTKSGYPKKPGDDVLRIYTTRPDTLFGATYMVIAPEHPFVERLTTSVQKAAVEKYCKQAAAKSDRERAEDTKSKAGVFTGSYAINPVNGERVPIWIADYVLISYGTGAIMAVPAHDTRDMEFAKQFGLKIRRVVEHSSGGEYDYSRAFLEFADEHHFSNYSLAIHLPKENADASTEAIGKKLEQIRDYLEIHDAGQEGMYLLVREPIEGIEKYGLAAPRAQIGLNEAFTFEGTAINSPSYDGLTTADFKERVTQDLSSRGLGRQAVNYKLRDWLFSRQRFWGEPFPILHELDDKGEPTGLLRAVDPADLPVDLPHLDDYKPHGRAEPPLAKAPDEWLYVTIDGQRYRRETNTMPQWAGSCWYYLRFVDPKNSEAFVDPAKEKAWMPVDLYVGGAEHAVLHLLYARFWHKVLFDRGYVSTPEPFQRLVNQGMILGEREFYAHRGPDGTFLRFDANSAMDSDGSVTVGEDAPFEPVRVPASQIDTSEKLRPRWNDHPDAFIDSRSYKMSKSRGNVVNPDHVVREYGADSLRLYEMFMGPLEASKPWSMAGVNGVRNFLDRAWRMIVDERAESLALNEAVQSVEPNEDQNRVLHKTIMAVTRDIERLDFNTAIARMMEFVNFFTKESVRPQTAMEQFVLLLSPYAPHLAEELWQILGHDQTLAYEPWPKFDKALTKEDTIEVPVQVNGKLRARISVAADSTKDQLEAAAKSDDRVAEVIGGKQIVKVVVVPGKLVNFVVK